MRWPWQREQAPTQRLAYSVWPDRLAWAVGVLGDPGPRLLSHGVLRLQPGEAEHNARALRALGLPEREAIGVLPLQDYQLLQIEAPSVPQEELKAAARWRIKDLVNGHIDEVTLDVLRVGSPQAGSHQLFVVAATNESLKAMHQQTQAAGLDTAVIDVVDTVQRNLHSRVAARLDLAERATACLMRHGPQCLLSICMGDELYYSRRLDWDAALPERIARPGQAASAAPAETSGLQWAGDAMAYELGALAEPADQTPRMVIELQRSFDVWERSWPDQPVAQLMVQAGALSNALAVYLQDALGLRVQGLDLALALPGAEQGGAWDGEQGDCLPLLGALLRQDAPQR
jgi:MSHA biogenesis protein MshI